MPGGVVWFGGRLRYFLRDEPGYQPVGVTFQLQVGRAASPADFHLQSERDMQSLGAVFAGVAPPDVNLAALDPSVAQCNFWNDPGVFFDAGRLYVVAECNQFDLATWRVAVFSTDANGAPKSWTWRFDGLLADAAVAKAVSDQLGVQADTLLQPDLARGKDGRLVAILSPTRGVGTTAAGQVHLGGAAIELDSLSPVKLTRDCDGRLRIRAFAAATDEPNGTSSTGYDPASATGMVLARRPDGKKTNGVVNGFSLHRTGLSP
jgi:hypothetical protein